MIFKNSRRFREVGIFIPAEKNTGSPQDTVYRGEKEHTSKRVSVIVPDNAISKTKCATRTRPRKNLPRNVKISSKF